MLSSDVFGRMSIMDFARSQWFKDPFIQSIYILEHIFEKGQAQQMLFLKGLQSIILKYEKKILVNKIIPGLIKALENP